MVARAMETQPCTATERHVRLPPISALVAFKTVARTRSFSRAAEELCITRGAVGHRIAVLESFLGVPVMIRGPQEVVLTPAGAAYLSSVSESLSVLADATAAISGTKCLHHLRVNALPAFAGSWLIARLSGFQVQYPKVEVEVDPLTYPLGEFDTVGLDLAIRYTKVVPEGFSGYCIQPINLVPVCSPDYLKRFGSIFQPADLLGAQLLRHNADPWKTWFDAADIAANIPAPVATFGDGRLLLDAAASGQGVALARDILAAEPLREGALVQLFDLQVVSPSSYYALLRSDASKAARAFVDWLLEEGHRA